MFFIGCRIEGGLYLGTINFGYRLIVFILALTFFG